MTVQPSRLVAAAGMALCGIAVAIGLALAVTGAGQAGMGATASEVFYLIPLAAAAAMCLARAGLRGDERFAWLAIGIGFALWFAGDVFFWFDESGPAIVEDIAYFGFYAAAAIGVARLVHMSGWRSRDLLDTGIGLTGLACVWAVFVADHVAGAQNDPALAVLVYPIADLALAVVALGLLHSVGWRPQLRWLLISGGFFAIALADSIYVVKVAEGTYLSGTVLDFLWPVGAAAVGLAAWLRSPSREPAQAHNYSIFVAAVAVLAAVAMLVTDHFSSISLVSLVLAVVTIALGAIRFCVTHWRRMAAEHSLGAEAQRTEQALERLAEAQALAHLGSWELDVTANRVVWSDELYAIHGIEPDQFAGTFDAVLEAIHPEDRQAIASSAQAAQRTREPFHSEFRILRPDGQVRSCDLHGEIGVDAGGKIVRVYGTVQDITERKLAEDELRSSKQLLQAVLDGSTSLIFIKDRAFRYLLANHSYERKIGVEPGEMIGRTDEHILDPEAIEFVRSVDRKVLETGEPVEVEHVLLLHDGSHVFSTHKYPLRDAQNEVFAVCAISSDITVQKQGEQELRRRAEREGAVARLGVQAIAGMPLAELLQEASTILARRLDVEYTKVLELQEDGKQLLLRAAVGHADGMVDRATMPASTQTQAGYTLRAEAPVVVEDLATETRFTGAELLQDRGVVSGISTRIQGDQGAFGVVAAHTTRRRSFTEGEVHFLQAVANVLGWAITRERAERLEVQLRQSQRLESVGQLAGGIAHDFNNLLAVILNYAAFAIDSLEAEDPIRNDVREIEKAAKRAADLTRQLLAFSRREVVTPEALNINVIVGETESMLRRPLGENIELRTTLGAHLRDVMIDAGQLEQILVNLAVNARDAMPDGGVLHVSTENLSLDREASHGGFTVPPGDYVRLTVSDTGTGMTEQVLAQVFDPFFTTKPKGQGTGLGLASVYGTVKQAGGYINLHSQEGHGTVVRVYLPATTEERREAPAPEQGDILQGDGETVLIVEDEDGVRNLTERILCEHGYQVVAAADGESAFQACAGREPIDLLLTDVVMPHMSGKELAEQIRTLQPELRTLYMSGYPNEVMASSGVIEDGVLLVEKPFTASALLEKVHAALELRPV